MIFHSRDSHVPLTLRATIFPSGVSIAANGGIDGSLGGTNAPAAPGADAAAATGDAEFDRGDGVEGATRLGGIGGGGGLAS